MDIREAFLRLGKRDKLVLAGFVALGMTLVIVIFYYALNGFFSGNATFPDSPANPYGEVQQKKTPVYADLPKMIVFPDTQRSVDVGGEEIGVLHDGTAFLFSEEAYIIAAIPEKSKDTKEYIETRFYSLLQGEETGEAGTYMTKKASEGYYNAEYLTYDGGILNTPDGRRYYILSYRHATDGETDALIAVVTSDENRLKDAMSLLNRMWETMDDIKEEELVLSAREEEAPEAAEVPEGEEAGEKKEMTFEELMAERDDQMHQNSFGEAKYIEKGIVIPKEWSNREVLFYFEYENVGKKPEEIVLTSPSGEKYEPNEVRIESGQIFFRIFSPEEGLWEMRVSNNTVFGKYRLNAMLELAGDAFDDAYMEEKNEEQDPEG